MTYTLTWRNKFLTAHVTTFDEMIDDGLVTIEKVKVLRYRAAGKKS